MHSLSPNSVSLAAYSADFRRTFPAAEDPAQVGTGTFYPIGLTRWEFSRLFSVKEFDVFGTLPGQVATRAKLGNFLTPKRHQTFTLRYGHGTPNSPLPEYSANVSTGQFGFTHDGKFWPAFVVTFAGNDDEPDPDVRRVGAYSTLWTEFGIVGFVEVIGHQIDIYAVGSASEGLVNPGGNIYFSTEEKFTP